MLSDLARMQKKTAIALFIILIAVAPTIADQAESDEKPELRIKYGPKGWELSTADGNYMLQLERYPKPLEVAFRHAIYNPDKEKPKDLQQEFSLALNWFFNGHRSKLTAEVSYLDFQFKEKIFKDEFRFRIQWDFSF